MTSIRLLFRYVGVCLLIKVMSVLIFLLDWWLIRSRQNSEKKQAALTVGEVVNSIISLDKREHRKDYQGFIKDCLHLIEIH